MLGDVILVVHKAWSKKWKYFLYLILEIKSSCCVNEYWILINWLTYKLMTYNLFFVMTVITIFFYVSPCSFPGDGVTEFPPLFTEYWSMSKSNVE